MKSSETPSENVEEPINEAPQEPEAPAPATESEQVNDTPAPDATPAETNAVDDPAEAPHDDTVPPADQAAKRPTKAPSHNKRKILILVILALIVVLNVGTTTATVYLHRKTKAVVPKTVPAVTNTSKSSSSAATNVDANSTLHYASSSLHLEFDYPISWRLSATAGNNSIELTSEQFSFKDYKGATASGSLYLDITSKDSGSNFGYIPSSAQIMSNSTSLSYKNPTTVQRKVTNLTYVLSDTSNADAVNANAVDYLLVTGGMAYKAGQTLADKDYQSTDPQIYAYIYSCPEAACKYLATGSTTVDEWNSNENLKKVQDVIASVKVTQ